MRSLKTRKKDERNALLLVGFTICLLIIPELQKFQQTNINWNIVYITSTMGLIILLLYKGSTNIKFFTRDLTTLRKMDDHEFEHYVAGLMRETGYKKVRVMPRGPDGGKDIIAYTSRGKKVIVECKRYAEDNKIDREKIMKLHSAMIHEKADKALFVTTSYFASTCAPYASGKNIELIDAQRLHWWNQRAQSTESEDILGGVLQKNK